MAALAPGTIAPDFSLPAADGKSFSLQHALERGPVLLAFFKISCPTCQYAFPFIERLYKAYGQGTVSIVGVSQNSRKDTALFLKEYGITLPILLDELDRYPVSNAYGLTNVPTLFWISQNGEIDTTSVGWDRGDFEKLNSKAAAAGAISLQPLFHPGEQVAAFRAG
jgi:peroxiredoxin